MANPAARNAGHLSKERDTRQHDDDPAAGDYSKIAHAQYDQCKECSESWLLKESAE